MTKHPFAHPSAEGIVFFREQFGHEINYPE